jgi:hypothetical protein
MVLEDGPFPYGRKAVFVVRDVEKELHIYVCKQKALNEVQKMEDVCLPVHEYVEMRDGTMIHVRDIHSDGTSIHRVDFTSMPSTDCGYIACFYPHLLHIFEFDELGDVASVKWELAHANKCALRHMIQPHDIKCKTDRRLPYMYGFLSNMRSKCACDAWKTGNMEFWNAVCA